MVIGQSIVDLNLANSDKKWNFEVNESACWQSKTFGYKIKLKRYERYRDGIFGTRLSRCGN